MSLNLTNKNIFKWIAISGICGILSLIFDQLSIQQETEIRNASELTQEAVNEQIYIANINQSILDFQRTLNIFTDNSAITYIYLSKLNTNLWDLYSSGKDYQIAQAEMLQLKSLFEKNIRSFINNTTDFFKENKFYYTQLRLLNDESNQVLDSIINKDYYLNQTWVISSDSESMADEISFYSVLVSLDDINNDIVRLNEYLLSTSDTNKQVGLVLKGSFSASVKQRYLLFGTTFQILSLMFLIIFFRSLLADPIKKK